MSTFVFEMTFFLTTQPPPICRYGPAQNHWSQNGWLEYLKNDQICGLKPLLLFFGQGNVIKIWNATMSSTFGQPLLMDAAVSKAVDLAAKLRHTVDSVDRWRTRFGALFPTMMAVSKSDIFHISGKTSLICRVATKDFVKHLKQVFFSSQYRKRKRSQERLKILEMHVIYVRAIRIGRRSCHARLKNMKLTDMHCRLHTWYLCNAC